MGLNLDAPPESAILLVAGAVADAAALPGSADAAADGEGEAARPVPVFQPRPGAGEGASGLGEADRTGWRFVVRGTGGLSVVDLFETQGGDLRLQRIRGARPATRLLKAAAAAEAALAEDGDYSVRILALPELHLEILWLAGAASNRFVSLETGEEVPEADVAADIERRRAAASAPATTEWNDLSG